MVNEMNYEPQILNLKISSHESGTLTLGQLLKFKYKHST